MRGPGPASSPNEPASEPLRGIAFMCLAALVLPFLNASAKHLGLEYAIVQIVWARYAGHLVYCIALFGPARGRRLFRSARLGVQILRSFLLLAATACYFTALRHVPLPTAATIGFTSPLMVTVLAVPMLGERVGLRRSGAALLGFAGALVVIRPGLGATHPAALLVLAAAFSYALYQILTRRVSAFDPPETTITYTAIVGTAATTLLLPLAWRAPDAAADAALLLGLGLFAGLGHFLVVKAYQHAPASVVSPFNYVQLVGATALGFAVFGDVPDAWTWVGASMIVGGGLYTMVRERAIARGAAPVAGPRPRRPIR